MSEMKAWQHGYDLDYLKGLEEDYFRHHNAMALSPFTKVKKNTIADLLRKDELVIKDGFAFAKHQIKSKSVIKTHDTVITSKLPGEIVFTKISISNKFYEDKMSATDLIGSLQLPVDKTLWAEVWAEDSFMRSIVEAAGYKYVTSKVMSTAEIVAVYVLARNVGVVVGAEFDTFLPETEKVNIRPVQLPGLRNAVPGDGIYEIAMESPLVNEIEQILNRINITFEVHYSNYNEKKTWSALSLRGFSPDIRFIEKPSEMNDKWHEKHHGIDFKVQNTELMGHFPQVLKIMDMIPGEKERVRFMKLAKDNGALLRHTDIVDKDSGTADGKIMRLHIPIITNPNVTFYSWKLNGECDTVHMEKGSCWYLDTRKPHAAVNKGETDRVHLVIDVWANDDLRKLMMHEGWEPAVEEKDPHELPFDPYTNPDGKDPYDAD